MSEKPKEEKSQLHPRNLHRMQYNLEELSKSIPELKEHIITNKFGGISINFFNPESVKLLNKALLKQNYHVDFWDIPSPYLCPPIPGRADYIHYLADLLAESGNGKIPVGGHIKGLDIGVGANAVFPLIGNASYGWNFVGSDIDPKAIANAKLILSKNEKISNILELRQQKVSIQIFKEIILPNEKYDFTISNPPFHESAEDAKSASMRKSTNLLGQKVINPVSNFGGIGGELWCNGGEKTFIQQMIYESAAYKNQVVWFTSLVSKQTTLASLYKKLKEVNAVDVKTIEMSQGQKSSRIVAWTFMSKQQIRNWFDNKARELVMIYD